MVSTSSITGRLFISDLTNNGDIEVAKIMKL